MTRARYRRGSGPLLGFVGRLVEEKGIADLVRAVALLRDDCPDVTAFVAGAGQHRDRFEALAAFGVAPDRIYVDYGLTGTTRD